VTGGGGGRDAEQKTRTPHKDVGKKDDCPTLQRISSLHVEDADTSLFKILVGCGQAMNIPAKTVKLGADNFTYPVLLPKDVLLQVAKRSIHKVIGMPLGRASETLKTFWGRYKLAFPKHDIFTLGLSEDEFSNIVPYYLHGDGGRTCKKESIVIRSMFPALGMGSAKCQVPDMQPTDSVCRNRKRRRSQVEAASMSKVNMGINLLGNSLGNRFLFAAIHSKYIKDDKEIFYDLLDLWGKEMGTLFDKGLQIHGRVCKIAVLGMCGDAPFIRDAGLMTRSFNNIRKSPDSVTLLPGVCHLCAGKTHGPLYEDLDILMAPWVATAGENNFLPWDEPSPLLNNGI